MMRFLAIDDLQGATLTTTATSAARAFWRLDGLICFHPVRHLRSVGRAPGPVLRDRRRHIASARRAPVLARQSHSDHSFDIAQIGEFLAARDE
jgi:hypothetical protein